MTVASPNSPPLPTGFGVHASRSAAGGLFNHLDAVADFVIIDGGKTGPTNRGFHHSLEKSAIITDPYGQPGRVATIDNPFDILNGGLFDQRPDESVREHLNTGSIVGLIPIGFVEAGARQVVRALPAACADLCQERTALRLPIHSQWLAGPDLDLLIAAVNSLPIPAVLCPGGDPRDPLASPDAVAGLAYFAQNCPTSQVWHTDLAGLGAFAFGSPGFAIGMGSSQRHTFAPGQVGHRNSGTDSRPSRIVEAMFRWRTAANLDAGTVTHTCEEECCRGESLKALTNTEARRHNLLTARRYYDILFNAEDRPAAFYKLLSGAFDAQMADPDLTPDRQLLSWLDLYKSGRASEIAS